MRGMHYDFDSSSVVFKSINMKQFYLLLIFLLLLSCNKQTDTSVKTIKAKAVIIPKIKVEGNAIEIDSAIVLSFENQKLLEFYRATGFKTVWQSDMLRKVVLNAIKDSHKEGLFPDDYRIKVLEALENKHALLKKKDLINYDLVLTLNTQLFLTHLKLGKLDPKKIYNNWDIERAPFDVNELLAESFAKKDFVATIDSCKPNSKVYNQLKKALELIEEFSDSDFSSISFADKIIANDTNPKILSIKNNLLFSHH